MDKYLLKAPIYGGRLGNSGTELCAMAASLSKAGFAKFVIVNDEVVPLAFKDCGVVLAEIRKVRSENTYKKEAVDELLNIKESIVRRRLTQLGS